MKLVCLADTHNKHERVSLPEGDVLIHAGDCTEGGSKQETKAFLEWFANQPHPHKILVPGNHDFFFEKVENRNQTPENITLLIDSGKKIEGINFWGSPVSPGDHSWAFNRGRGREIATHWNSIPSSCDVLITHTPAYGFLDELPNGTKMGDEELRRRIGKLNLRAHIFGHIHYAAGAIKRQNIHFINATQLDEQHRLMHSPIVLEL